MIVAEATYGFAAKTVKRKYLAVVNEGKFIVCVLAVLLTFIAYVPLSTQVMLSKLVSTLAEVVWAPLAAVKPVGKK